MITGSDSRRARPEDRERRLAELSGLIAAHLDRPDDPVPGLRLFATHEPGEPTSSIAEASFAFVAQGAKQVAVGDQVLDYGPGDYLVVSLDLPVTGRFTAASRAAPFLGIGLTLDPVAVAELVVTTPSPDRARTPLRAGLGTSAASEHLLDALARLLRLWDEPGDRAVLAPLVVREILWRLLCGPQGDLVRAIGMQRSPLGQIARAVRWIRAHYDEPFRVEDLAEYSAMSTSTFHRQFRAATTMGPIQYQKKVRLQQARLLLLGSALDVTGVAHTVGYASASQFSREYRREFAASPSRDASSAAGHPAGAAR